MTQGKTGTPPELTPGISSSELLGLFRGVHQRLREAFRDAGGDDLNWCPGRGANSVGALVAHVARTERRNIQRVLGVEGDAPVEEWGDQAYSREDVLATLDAADAFLEINEGALTPTALASAVRHPHRGASGAVTLLVQTYGHVKEHVGHIELTLQLGAIRRSALTGQPEEAIS